MTLNEKLIGKTIQCLVAEVLKVDGPKPYNIVTLEITDGQLPDDLGLSVKINSFQQSWNAGDTVPVTFAIGGKNKDALVGSKPKSSEEEKADRKTAEEAAKAKRIAAEEQERKDYEAEMAKGGGNGNPQYASESTPAANLILEPNERHIMYAKKYGFEPDDIKVMEQTNILPKDTPIPIASLFFRTAQMQGLNPLLKQMYLVAYGSGDKRTFTQITAIDSMRSKALATREYVGKPKILFDGLSASEWMRTYNNHREYEAREVKKNPTDRYTTKEHHLIAGEFPQTASATVMRLVDGRECPFEVEIIWNEYYPGPGGKGQMWRERPFGQFGKCAEAIALRVAFADALSRMYVAEEFERAAVVAETVDAPMQVIDMRAIFQDLKNLHTEAELIAYKRDHPEYANDGEIQEAIGNRHKELTTPQD